MNARGIALPRVKFFFLRHHAIAFVRITRENHVNVGVVREKMHSGSAYLLQSNVIIGYRTFYT